ncbi:MAG: hypothetical protein IT565_14260 [Rhodospirillales bacterium]|nr:hypothetical protein [Rhodospirillales bacterium]
MEWWGRRVILGLSGELSRQIPKTEYLERLSGLISQHSSDALPNDYGEADAPEDRLEWDSPMVDQMVLVGAGRARIARALGAHWRAAQQRERWVAEDISVGAQLQAYDGRLVRAWRDLHAPMCDDCEGKPEGQKIERGRELLDWSHTEAHLRLPPVRPSAPNDFITQGTYQILAADESVGWHPEFKRLLKETRKHRRKS